MVLFYYNNHKLLWGVISLSAYKEIVTKAVIGKGKKYYRNTYTVDTESKPNTVLGCIFWGKFMVFIW